MFARTPRLLLRPGWMDDAEALAHAIGDQRVVRNLATAPWPYGIDQARDFLALCAQDTTPNFLIFLRTQGLPQLIGGIGLAQRDGDCAEFGYWIAPSHWGLGFATEAGRAVIAIARIALPLRVLSAGHFIDNPASGRVLRKLGFRPTGRLVDVHSAARGQMVPGVEHRLDLLAEADGDDGGSPGSDPRGGLPSMRSIMQLAA